MCLMLSSIIDEDCAVRSRHRMPEYLPNHLSDLDEGKSLSIHHEHSNPQINYLRQGGEERERWSTWCDIASGKEVPCATVASHWR